MSKTLKNDFCVQKTFPHVVVSVYRDENKKQLRYLVHSAGTIDPIKPVFEVQPEELIQHDRKM